MKDKSIYIKRFFKLWNVILIITFLFFITLGVVGIFYEDDMPIVAFVYSALIFILYWISKKIEHRYLKIKVEECCRK